MKIFAKLIMAISVVAALAGCSTQGMEPHEELLARSVVASGVIKYVDSGDDPAARAKNTVEVVDKLLSYAGEGEAFTLDELEAEARRQIPWKDMNPEDAVLVDALIHYVRAEMERRVEDSTVQLPTNELVEMRDVLHWVREAAVLYTGEE